ncbi:MAG: putative glycosyltransferase [Anaerolineales bacterium]|nr:putative glycosyltransferase [Anaerolineales bacterium]
MTVSSPRARGVRLRAGERRLILVAGDVLSAVAGAAVALSLWGRFDYLGPTAEFIRVRAVWFMFLPLLWPLFMVNLYDVHRAGSWRDTVRGVFLAVAAGAILYLLLYFVQGGSLARRGILYFLAATLVFTLLWRAIYIRVFTAPALMRRVLIVGAGLGGRTLLQIYNAAWPKPFLMVGLIDDDPEKRFEKVDVFAVLGGSGELPKIIAEAGATDLIVAIQGQMTGAMFQSLLEAQEQGVEITRLPVAYEDLLGRLPIQHLEADWLLRSFVDELRVSGLYLLAKRLLDLAGAVFGLAIFALLLPWVAAAILLDSGRPIFFRQARLGQGGRPYRMIKLRTMRQDAEADGQPHWAASVDPRATRVGRILRRTHLDEFPQFWSVVRGDMSLVGPRPERPELVAELEKQIPFYRARLLAKPGITGWAQVNYGKGASVEGSAEKLEFDLYYIKHRNLWMDLWILVRTVGSVFRFKGV